jgi:hypothetical protein
MGNIYTDLATAQKDALTDLSKAPNLRSYGGDVRHIDVVITATGATADPVYLARLPKGARLLPQLCSVDFEDPGDALTGKIGHIYDDGTGDDDAYGAALALGNAAGRKEFSEAGTKGAAFLAPVTLAKDAWIYVTWTTATSAVSAKQTWHLAYTLG